MKLNVALALIILFSITHVKCQSPAKVPELKFSDERITRFYEVEKEYQQVAGQLKADDLSLPGKEKLGRQLKKLKAALKTTRTDFESAVKEARQQTRAVTGEFTLRFNGQWYDGIIVDPKKHRVHMHWLAEDESPHRNLGSVKRELETKGKHVLMLTNGGMYLQDNSPQGLFIEGGKERRPIVLDSNKYGNFYLKPNGVFYIDASGGHIVTSETFAAKKIQCEYATQSGPMLTIDGKINVKFKHGSTSFYLRSGVGILPDGRMVFLISRSNETNFHDFASIFTDVFGCPNALYLDGAISKMYLEQSRKDDLGGNLGPIISVSE